MILDELKLLLMTSEERGRYRSKIRKHIFSEMMKERALKWSNEPLSGGGSTKDVTITTRQIVKAVIDQHNIESMLDVPCGDLTWMPLLLTELPKSFQYIGADIVDGLVEQNRKKYPGHSFRALDFVCDELPKCDLIFCRDALQHLPIPDIKMALGNFSKCGAQYLLTTTHLRRYGLRNMEPCRVGSCRNRNLLLNPFNLRDPIAIFSEQSNLDKFLGLWKLPL